MPRYSPNDVYATRLTERRVQGRVPTRLVQKTYDESQYLHPLETPLWNSPYSSSRSANSTSESLPQSARLPLSASLVDTTTYPDSASTKSAAVPRSAKRWGFWNRKPKADSPKKDSSKKHTVLVKRTAMSKSTPDLNAWSMSDAPPVPPKHERPALFFQQPSLPDTPVSNYADSDDSMYFIMNPDWNSSQDVGSLFLPICHGEKQVSSRQEPVFVLQNEPKSHSKYNLGHIQQQHNSRSANSSFLDI